MNFPHSNTDTSHSSLLHLMSQTLNPAQDPEPSDYDSEALVRKTSSLDIILAQISTESLALRERCALLAQETSEVKQMGDDIASNSEKGAKREFSMQMLTSVPRKMRPKLPFSLIFRVIDRDGSSVKLHSSDIFEVKVVKASTNISNKKSYTTPRPLPSIIGPSMVSPTFEHEVVFAGISLSTNNIPVVGIKVSLCVTCINRPEIKPFELQPFVIRCRLS
jgi:hypothetical protein